jgi:hypothetical protein
MYIFIIYISLFLYIYLIFYKFYVDFVSINEFHFILRIDLLLYVVGGTW